MHTERCSCRCGRRRSEKSPSRSGTPDRRVGAAAQEAFFERAIHVGWHGEGGPAADCQRTFCRWPGPAGRRGVVQNRFEIVGIGSGTVFAMTCPVGFGRLHQVREEMRHCGKTYHEFMLGSPRDRKVRERFQRLVLQVVPPHGTILDFGAGTGIDAARYAAEGFRVLVHEPSDANLAYLGEHCRQQIASGSIAITDLTDVRSVEMIVANFAVLNLICDHRALFAKFAGLLAPGGFVLASLLNPFSLGDARYAWWRRNLPTLLANGAYTV